MKWWMLLAGLVIGANVGFVVGVTLTRRKYDEALERAARRMRFASGSSR